MQITVIAGKQKIFKIDIEPDSTILNLKQKIEVEQGKEYPVAEQSLIYGGKFFANDKKIYECGINEKKCLLMIVKSKSLRATYSEFDAQTFFENVDEEDEAEDESAEELVLEDGSDFERNIEHVMEMGFSRDQVEQTLRVSFNNPVLAIEYLLNVNAETSEQELSMASVEEGTSSVNGNDPTNTVDSIAFIRNHPQFHEMRNTFQQNQLSLNTMLEEIAQNDPNLLDIISENPEAFIILLNEPDSEPSELNPNLEHAESIPLVETDTVHPIEMHVTPPESDALDRLMALGFPENNVIEAFIACDKNENLAANYLLSNFD